MYMMYKSSYPIVATVCEIFRNLDGEQCLT